MADVQPRGTITIRGRGPCGEELSYTTDIGTLVRAVAAATPEDAKALQGSAKAAMAPRGDGTTAIDSGSIAAIIQTVIALISKIKPAPTPSNGNTCP